jgi:uncharacterized protein YneF (UPF0154 family)
MAVLACIGAILNLLAGITIGMWLERWNWNELIKEGKIPESVKVKK